ncbi:molybdenum cofactor biosynthesis protein MoaA [Ignicoccus pacificus DSM 13166]|uniref:Molybdenum cofactor biosynthesis protein MoaA n=1 Tax=Ignicoccus pacificus DSM 13166 TaxID=940294 RepID=A0A977KA91_9CREN|nr:molybdenum cofactor biosynthesis protein MoaA [Ignicoccus pacificus DSM 13166]
MLRKLTPVSEVIERFVSKVSLPNVEEIEVRNGTGLYVAEEVRAREDNPPVPKSVLDGYAVNSEDLIGASEISPVTLEIDKKWEPGKAVYVHTGDPIPEGADTVVPIETVRVEGDILYVFKQYPPGNAIAKVGEDLKAGETIVEKGTLLRPWHVAALASQGIWKVKVFKPKIALASTGDEIVEPWEEGGVRNSTAWLVYSFLKERLGVEPDYFGIIKDNPDKIREFFEERSKEYDVVITTGGTSVGKRDHSARVVKDLAEEWVHGVALTPGRPLCIGTKDGKLLVALSGYPVAALSELEVVVWELLKRAWGLKEPPKPKVRAKLTRRLPVTPNMVHVYRVKVFRCGGELCVEPLRLTGSGVLSSLLRGNGLLIAGVGGETGYDVGDYVEVELLSDIT